MRIRIGIRGIRKCPYSFSFLFFHAVFDSNVLCCVRSENIVCVFVVVVVVVCVCGNGGVLVGFRLRLSTF